jgi:hypothetical protein
MRSAVNRASQEVAAAVKVGSDGAQLGPGCRISIDVFAEIGAAFRLESTTNADLFCFKLGDTPRRR